MRTVHTFELAKRQIDLLFALTRQGVFDVSTKCDFHTFELTEEQAEMIHKQISSHCSALKNWIVSRVESGKLEEAQELVRELRKYQDLYAQFNMPSKREIARVTGKPLETFHRARL